MWGGGGKGSLQCRAGLYPQLFWTHIRKTPGALGDEAHSAAVLEVLVKSKPQPLAASNVSPKEILEIGGIEGKERNGWDLNEKVLLKASFEKD